MKSRVLPVSYGLNDLRGDRKDVDIDIDVDILRPVGVHGPFQFSSDVPIAKRLEEAWIGHLNVSSVLLRSSHAEN